MWRPLMLYLRTVQAQGVWLRGPRGGHYRATLPFYNEMWPPFIIIIIIIVIITFQGELFKDQVISGNESHNIAHDRVCL